MPSVQENLLLANEYAKHLTSHLNQAYMADNFKDKPQMYMRLRKLVEASTTLAQEVASAQNDYDDLDF